MKMKMIVATALAAATLFATPVLAAQRVHHARQVTQVRGDYDTAYARGDVVMSSNHVIGQDPDPSIRTQILHEGEVSAN